MTLVVPKEYGGPPNYPTSQMMPSEYWRKQPDGIPNNPQTISVEVAPHVLEKREVEPGWDNAVRFPPLS
ncbi:hypothetical protein SEA_SCOOBYDOOBYDOO_101 [Mycobacterium phage ScoobyDoobyDoo]|nr:hypothetical protein SEA_SCOOBYDOOBYDOO_101 [Mycobacterium phage ScoobyDoobyDoo]